MTIRFASPDDARALLSIYAPYVQTSCATFEWETPSETAFAERIRGVLQAGYPYLALEEDGRIVGYCYAAPFAQRAAYRPSADLSLYLAPEAQQRGAGRALYECAMRLCRAQGIENVYGVVTASNAASRALHERMGFRLAGTLERVGYKFGVWHGVCYYEKFLGAHDTPWRGLTPVGGLDAGFVAETMRACAAAVRETPRELWELMDAQRRPTGVLHRRGDPLPDGLYHLVVDILTVNPRGELLLTLRAAGKRFAGQWEITGGAARAGETSREAAVRELREETGLLASPEELLPIAQDRREQSQSVRDIYLYRCPQERPAVALQAGETEDFRWAARAQVEALIGAGTVCEPIARLYEALRDNAALACLR